MSRDAPAHERRRRLLFVVPLSAALIVGLAAFKLTRRYPAPVDETAADVRAAPLFQLYDEHSQIVRLARYIGRHKLLIVFYDGRRGPDHSPLLTGLRERFAELHATKAIVLAISAARPSENRYGVNLEHHQARDETGAAGESGARYPFPLLSDILDYEVHRRYGAFDFAAQKPLEAVYVVDRSGVIQHVHRGPDHLGRIEDWVNELQGVK